MQKQNRKLTSTHPGDDLLPPKGVIHIWLASLDIDKSFYSSLKSALSPDEIDRASKFRFMKDRARFIGARGLLRNVIGGYLKRDPAEIDFRYGKFGKPDLQPTNPLKFNISHTNNVAVFVFGSDIKVGIDIEKCTREIDMINIARRFFSENEILALLDLPEIERVDGFFNCWTRKEAFIKAVGEGLSIPLDAFEVSLKPESTPRLLATHWDPDEAAKWSLHTFTPRENYVGAVAVRSPIKIVKFFPATEEVLTADFGFPAKETETYLENKSKHV